MEPACRSSRSSGSLCSQRERPLQKEAGFPQLSPTHDNQRKPACSNEDPAQAKVNKSNYFVKKKKKKDSVSPAASLKRLKLNSHRISSSWSSPTALI